MSIQSYYNNIVNSISEGIENYKPHLKHSFKIISHLSLMALGSTFSINKDLDERILTANIATPVYFISEFIAQKLDQTDQAQRHHYEKPLDLLLQASHFISGIIPNISVVSPILNYTAKSVLVSAIRISVEAENRDQEMAELFRGARIISQNEEVEDPSSGTSLAR